MRNLAIQLYFAAYEHAKRDIEIKEEKTARLRVEQLEVLKKKEKKVKKESGPI